MKKLYYSESKIFIIIKVVEHGWRLHQMLKLKKIPHEWVIIHELGHGFETTGELSDFYDKVMPFLKLHLN